MPDRQRRRHPAGAVLPTNQGGKIDMMTRVASAKKTGRNPKFPFVPVVILRDGARDREMQIRGFAFSTRAKAIAFAEITIAHRNEQSAKAAAAYAAPHPLKSNREN